MSAGVTPEPFRLEVGQAVLDDLEHRLRRTRWPDDPDNETWRFGVNRAYLEQFVQWWLDEFDWRAVEGRDQRVAEFPGRRSTVRWCTTSTCPASGPDPLPLVLTHGWPWSWWDYRKVIGPLSDPAAHGGDPADAFDLIVPSIPGYGFSTPMRAGGIEREGHRGAVGAPGA